MSTDQEKHNTAGDDTRPSPFVFRWLAETVRVREQSGQLVEDGHASAVALANDAGMDENRTETRVLLRAHYLAEQDGTLEALARWRATARWLLAGFAALALILGFSAALTMIGDGGRPVNIVWTLGALLGLHLVMLMLWLLNMMAGTQSAGGVLGRLWLYVMQRIGGSQHAALTRGLIEVSLRGRLLRWYPSAITHGLWLLSLTAGTLALLLALALRSYDFVWETTILSPEVFVNFVQWTGALPATLGFMVPDASMVMASGDGELVASAERELLRRGWSSWLIGCLIVYGVLPRLMLLLLSLLVLRWRQQRLTLDLCAPQWAPLAARLSPVSERGGITDPQSGAMVVPKLNRDQGCTGKPVMLAIELRPESDWPPPGVARGVQVLTPVDSREQRAAAKAQLQQLRPTRLLLVCDARLSPDRGTLHWVVQISAFSAASRVWLLNSERAPPARCQSWQEALAGLGFSAGEIVSDSASALGWVAGADEGQTHE